MINKHLKFSAGFSLIDVVLSVGIVVLLFGGIYLIYFSILDVVNNLELRAAATSVFNARVEIIRNLAYENVGTQGGVPTGVIPQEQLVAFGGVNFTVKTTVRNIDDPFDGTLSGNPNDTAPADYKLVEMEVSCARCLKFVPLLFTTTVAPKNLESASNNGSLFVNVFDASGVAIGGVNVHVVNASVTPTIDLNDATNGNGVLQLVGVPTSTQSYQLEVSKAGYSSDKTYPLGAPSNPNPVKPHATVAAQTVTTVSFAIDKFSRVNLYSSGPRCEALPGINFSLKGTKLIGTNPDLLKFTTSSDTGASGTKTYSAIEWDTYSFLMTAANYDVLGTMPLTPTIINPSSTLDFRFILQPSLPKSLLVTVQDALSGAGITGSSVNFSKTGFSSTTVTGHSFFGQTDWSNGQYSSQSGGVDPQNPVGSLRLLTNASSTYSTTTVGWLISNTFDMGGSSSTLYSLRWNPLNQPPQTGAGSLKFQLATNNDDATWNFVGPDGTVSTYYVVSSSTIHSGQSSNRYLRYKVYLSTADENYSPQLDDVGLEFNSVCVPPYQVLFNNLSAGDYLLAVGAAGYNAATSSVSVTGDWQQIEVLMTSL